MAASPLKSVIEALLERLDEEQAAFLKGGYGAALTIAADKERLVTNLDDFLANPGNAREIALYRKPLAALIEKARRNEELIGAAKAGVIAAQSRIKDLIRRERTIGVYTESGEKPVLEDTYVTKKKLA
ncbi:MAG: hypothetical protein AB7P23_01565 [Amphiplicatus sp.]